MRGPASLSKTLLLTLLIVAVLVLSPITPSVTIGRATENGTSPVLSKPVLLYGNTATPIKHVIIAIYENHGFDNYFSQFLGPTFGDPPGGVPQPVTQTNTTAYNIPYFTNWNYASNESSDVPDHDVTAIHGNIDNGSMDGYTYTDTNVSDAMFPSYINPNLLNLAQLYGVGDSYFHAFAGPTLPNRFYYYADTSGPIVSDSGPSNNTVFFNTMPAELQSAGISWASYDGNFNEYNGTALCDIPAIYLCDDPAFYFTTTLSQLVPMLYLNWIQQYQGALGHLQPYGNIVTQLADGTLPAVSWYTPDWVCCTEHPGTIDGFGGNITQGEESLLELVWDIEQSPEWNSTALFVSFDEGGGFYESVPAPSITPYGDGVRMPLLVVSPYAKEGYVDHTYLTPSSLLHFIEYNWGLPSLQGGGPGLDTESNLPLGFFNFSEPPRLPFPRSLPGSNNLTAYPWSYTQSVPSGYIGTYKPALDSTGAISWSSQTNNVLLSTPVETADGSILYQSGMDGFLRAYDPITGAQLWSANLGQGSRSQPALLLDDGVIATTLRGEVSAYSATGQQFWNLSLGAPIYGGLTTVHGQYYGMLSNGTLFDVTENGSVAFERSVTWSDVYAPPAYDPESGLLLISTPSQGITATTLSGQVKWNDTIPGGVYAEGAVQSGTLYVTGVQGGIYPVSLPSGAVGAPASLGNKSVTSPYISGSTLYAGNESGYFAAYSLPSLTPQWSEDLYGGVAGTPQVSGSDVWVASDGGNLYEFPTSGGAALQTLSSGTSFYAGPLATTTGIYFGGDDGNLLAMNAGGELHLGVTPISATVTVAGAPVALTNGHATLGLAAGSVSVSASAPGYTTQTLSVTIPKGGAVWKNITLQTSGITPGTLSGTVTNASSGATLASVSVLVEPTSATTTSSAAGAYTLSLAPGTYAIFVNETGYKPFQLLNVAITTGATTTEPIALTPLHTGGGVTPGTLSGTVENASSSAPLASVTVLVMPSSQTITTGSAGTFSLSLDPGTYTLFVNASGYVASVTSDVAVTSSVTTSETIALTPVTKGVGPNPGALSGSVFNASNEQGLPSVAITITWPGGPASTTTSGVDGAYTVALAAGTYSVFVNATGYEDYLATGIGITAGQTTTHSIGLTPKPSTYTPPTNSTRNGGNAPFDWLLWGLILAVVAAAVVLLLALVVRNRKNRESMPPGDVMGEEAVGGAALAFAPNDPSVPPAESAPPPGGDPGQTSFDEVAPAPGEMAPSPPKWAE